MCIWEDDSVSLYFVKARSFFFSFFFFTSVSNGRINDRFRFASNPRIGKRRREAQWLSAGIDTSGFNIGFENDRNSVLLNSSSVRISTRNISAFIMSAPNVHRICQCHGAMWRRPWKVLLPRIAFQCFSPFCAFRFIDYITNHRQRYVYYTSTIFSSVCCFFCYYLLLESAFIVWSWSVILTVIIIIL